jgi:pycsar effector protein
MPDATSLRHAIAQLKLILGFFPRVERALSLVLAIDLALVGTLAVNAPALAKMNPYLLFAIVPLLFVCASLVEVYRGFFPRLGGPDDSLVYFRCIAARSESRFMDEWLARSDADHARDYLSEVWQNSAILKAKYDRLEKSFVLLAWSLPTWLITLAMFVVTNRHADVLISPLR